MAKAWCVLGWTGLSSFSCSGAQVDNSLNQWHPGIKQEGQWSWAGMDHAEPQLGPAYDPSRAQAP